MSRSSLPYYVAALAAAAALAWYFFLFVPAKLEYFVGVRLRTLAVAGSQVRSRAVNLASAMDRAARCGTSRGDAREYLQEVREYLRVLVPDVQLMPPPSAGLRLRAGGDPAPDNDPANCTATFAFEAGVTWPDLMTQAAELSRDEFEDLVLALPSGEVVWQREETTPRIGNLAQVLERDALDDRWLSFSWNAPNELPKQDAKPLSMAVTKKELSLGGRSMVLLVQPITLTSETFGPLIGAFEAAVPPATDGARPQDQSRRTLFLAGSVSRQTLRAQAMDVPLAWIVLLSLPMLLVFLALPFVKLVTLTTRERFASLDALALLASTIILASLAGAMPFVISPVTQETDAELQVFATALGEGLARDVKQVLALRDTVVTQRETLAPLLATCAASRVRAPTAQQPEAQETRDCDLWTALRTGARVWTQFTHAAPIDLDVVIWIAPDGLQVRKWTTKAQVTHRISHARRKHFRDLQTERLWELRGDGKAATWRFTIEPLRTPTTAELGVVIASPLTTSITYGGSATEAEERYIAFNLRLPSLQDVVVPPDHGFAVIGSLGEVLFHSDENRSLQENFFQEVSDAASVRRRAISGHRSTWSGDYHGRPHRLHIQQPSGIAGIPWRIVTFRDLGPTLAAVTAHQSDTFRLTAVNVAALALLAAVVLGVSRLKRREAGDLLNMRAVVRPTLLWWHVVLLVATLSGLMLTHVTALRAYINALYVLFALVPFLAILISVRARHTGWHAGTAAASATESAQSEAHSLLIRTELAMIVLLVAALPTAGFARIADRLQGIDQSVRWLEEMQRRVADRNQRVLTRLNGPAYAELQALTPGRDDPREWLRTRGFAQAEALDTYAYVAFLDRVDIGSCAADDSSRSAGTCTGCGPEAGQGMVRFLLDWNPFPSKDQAGDPAVTAAHDRLCLAPIVSGSPSIGIREPVRLVPDSLSLTEFSLPPAKLTMGMLLLAAVIGAAYRARRKLLVFEPQLAPTIETVVRTLPRGSHAIMLIGPPRTRKDEAVNDAVAKVGCRPDLRIRLLGAPVTRDFIAQQVDALRNVQDPARRVWIHVSNAEMHLVDARRRQRLLQLLEELLVPTTAGQERVVIVTTTVDPVAHFEEIFEEERRGIYETPVPEIALSRFSLLLTRFHRCYVPIALPDDKPDPWWNYDDMRWKDVLAWETQKVPNEPIRITPLRYAVDDLEAAWGSRVAVPARELAAALSARTYAYYQLLWTSCTRHEKLVLVQLAQEGFVTSHSGDVIAALMAKGLIVSRPGPTIFNHSFRTFLRRIERSDVVRDWERGAGEGLWVMAGRLVASSVAAGGLFFLLTQGYSAEALLPVISGTGVFGVPLVRELVSRLSGGASTAAAPSTA